MKLTNGRIIVKSSTASRGQEKRANHILYYKSNLPIAAVEAKRNASK